MITLHTNFHSRFCLTDNNDNQIGILFVKKGYRTIDNKINKLICKTIENCEDCTLIFDDVIEEIFINDNTEIIELDTMLTLKNNIGSIKSFKLKRQII